MSKYRADTVKEHLRNGVLLRNPVLVQAIGLFPVVAVATSLTSALLFAVVSAVILIIMETLTNLVLKHFPTWLRVGFYAIFSFAVIIPFIFLCEKFFADKLSPAAVFLPILSVNALISYRCERIAVGSSLKNSFWDAVTTSLGYGAVLLIVGFIRELLGKGSVFGYSIPNFPTVSGLLMPFGGFVILGFMAAALRWGTSRRYNYEATETAVDHIREEELEEKNGLKNLFGIAKTSKTSERPTNDTKNNGSKKKASPVKSGKKAENEAKAKLAAEKKQSEIQKREARAAADKAAAERQTAQKAERQKAEAERAAKIKADKEAAARLAEKKRRDEKLAAEKADKLKKAEAERKLAEERKRAEAAKLEKERKQAEAEKEKAKKQKKSSFFSAKPPASKADSKPVSKPSVSANSFFNENDLDYDSAWENYESRKAKKNHKEGPKS